MHAHALRSDFARALAGWRTRRRVSQLELALRAGTTQRHVSFVESGRSLPGRAMVVRLAEALELPLRERNGLLALAGYAPAYAETALDDAKLGAVREALDRILAGHRPYPAVAVGRGSELVAANTAFWTLVEGSAAHLLDRPLNVARLMLHPEGLGGRIVNFDEWAWHIVDAVRHEAARNPDERSTPLVAELEALAGDRPSPGANHLGFAVPLQLRTQAGELRLITTLTQFSTAMDVTISELRIEAFLPADDATAAALAALES